MAETTAKPTAQTASTATEAPVTTAQAAPAEKEATATAVVEVTLTRAVDSGTDHRHAADQFSADLASGMGEEWQESGRRVKSVRVQ